MKNEKLNVFWFRRDLRLNDNHGLFQALNDGNPVIPIFIFDTDILDDLKNEADPRVTFIYDNVADLHKKLKMEGSAMFVYHGKPLEIFKTLVKDHKVEKVFTNKDYEPYAKKRDNEVAKFLQSKNISFHVFKDHVIFESREIVKEDGNPYKVFTPYKNQWLQLLGDSALREHHSEKHRDNFIKTNHSYFPELRDIGFKRSSIAIPPLKIDTVLIKDYDKTRDFPAQNGTSRLGIHLRHGTLSIRQAVNSAKQLNGTWLQELVWREFYIMILDNFPGVVNEEFHTKYKGIPWCYDEEVFKTWCEGKTGYPIVDAGMRQLNETGYMHNRVRMVTASFLTKHLLIDWRWGEAYFGEKLLDYELASNNGGWQWAAGCGTDAQPYFRIFNPYEQARKFDPQHSYVNKWIPEINTKNYPDPIIDHKFARQRAIETFKKALNR